jgi:hypothetical protein
LRKIDDRAGGVGKGAKLGRSHVGMPQQVFAEDLARFQLGRLCTGTERANPRRRQRVDRSGRQRPITAKPMSFRLENSIRRVTSPSGMSTFSASRAVPALPGATKTWSMRLDWAIFQASACSRPPLPTTKTFMPILRSREKRTGYPRDSRGNDKIAEVSGCLRSVTYRRSGNWAIDRSRAAAAHGCPRPIGRSY